MIIKNLGIILVFICQQIYSYKPVILIHGILSKPSAFDIFTKEVKTAHNGTNVTVLHIDEGLLSLRPMWTLVNDMKPKVQKICQENPGGVNVVGHSQGGLVARAIIESLDNHTVDRFISLASPQNGQYAGNNEPGIIDFISKYMYLFFYTYVGQLTSVGGYFKDPPHLSTYYKTCKFLPKINNEIKHENSEQYKRNFLKIKKLVILSSKNDTVIAPLDSTQFGYIGADGNVITMEEQETYINDAFGLKTINKRGDLHRTILTGYSHSDLIHNPFVIQNYIIPWLN